MSKDFFENIDDFINSFMQKKTDNGRSSLNDEEYSSAMHDLESELRNMRYTNSGFSNDLNDFDERMKNLGYKPRESPKQSKTRSPGDEKILELARDYSNLEIEVGSNAEIVKSAYKKMLLQFHPDKFASDPHKQATATQITAKLNASYQRIMDYLKDR